MLSATKLKNKQKTESGSTVSIVSATRLTETEFWKGSALGQSLSRLRNDKRLRFHIAFNNTQGLPEFYNHHILNSPSQYICFIHDDVWIDDFFIVDRLIDALEHYDVIGVIGNKRRMQNQPSWRHIDIHFNSDGHEYLSGAIAHGDGPFGDVLSFQSTQDDCELLDGVFIASKTEVLRKNEILFDTIFKFHFYDMDFCRTARKNGLHIGTWPICLTHQSGGCFGSPPWREAFIKYLEKWGS